MLTYVFGDTHGYHDEAMELAAEVEAHAAGREHRRIWLGDYIDRGSHSAQVVEYLIASKARRPQDVFLMGNHEDMLLANVDDYPSPYSPERRAIMAESFFVNGGSATLASYGVGSILQLPQAHLDFFKSLVLSWQDERRYYVHAGIRPGVPLANQDRYDQLWIRSEFLLARQRFEKYVVHGHTPVGPEVEHNRCNLDSGIYINRVLTAGVFEDGSDAPVQLLQVSR
jgi:serine/threonine protein phosphatase 1